MSSNYWSSSTNVNNTDNAWHVNFNNGNVNNNNKTNTYYVRAVRGGKCSLLSFESIYQAYVDCRKNKRGTLNALKFELNLLDNLYALATKIQQGTYTPSRSVCFVTTTPKMREIFAADFRDRIVHHLVVRELEKTWETRFIHDSYASRKGKGTHAAVKRLQSFMSKVTRSGNMPAWFMQLDIRSFFMSIDRKKLFSIFEDAGTPDAVLYLLSVIIFSDCTIGHVFKGNRRMLESIPDHKTLFKAPPGIGLPIGNYTSQFFGNVYLHGLDRYVKHGLRCRFYIRYVDDFILLAQTPAQLHEWRGKIALFLRNHLGLELKDECRAKRVSVGADFLGYIVRPGYILARRRVVNNLKSKLNAFEGRIIEYMQLGTKMVEIYHIGRELVFELRQVLASYLGHFKHADTHNLIRSLFGRHAWLLILFDFENGKLADRLHPRVEYRYFRYQHASFRSLMPDYVLFFQVGNCWEAYNHDALRLERLSGVKIKINFRGLRHAAVIRPFMLKGCIYFLLENNSDVALVQETGPGKYIKKRSVGRIYRMTESTLNCITV